MCACVCRWRGVVAGSILSEVETCIVSRLRQLYKTGRGNKTHDTAVDGNDQSVVAIMHGVLPDVKQYAVSMAVFLYDSFGWSYGLANTFNGSDLMQAWECASVIGCLISTSNHPPLTNLSSMYFSGPPESFTVE
jgi:hypothetical protein